jgi:hypothetical protein
MQLWLEINDNKASFFMELIKNFSFVKAKTLTAKNELFLMELQEAVEEAKRVKVGKTEFSSARDFLNSSHEGTEKDV